MKARLWAHTIITAVILFTATTALFLYSSGYRLIKDPEDPNKNIDFKKTGMISARSIPEGANVYVNDVFTTATDDNVPSLDPGTYDLRITKDGYYPWQKRVTVYAERVTDITAVLVPQSPRFEPLTTTGARFPIVSPSLTKLAYFSQDGKESGIAIIPLTNQGLNLFRSNPDVVIEDTLTTVFSTGKSIEWGPDEEQLLVLTSNDRYFLIDLANTTSQIVIEPELIREEWEKIRIEDRSTFIEKLSLPEDLVEIALAQETLWAPDQKKFFYIIETESERQYRVYNMEDPLPVGEEENTLVFTTPLEDPIPFISWYADSFHLIMSENFNEETHIGQISLIRIDGTNKTTIYNSVMFSKNVFSAPGGEKLIFLTSFTPAQQTDLYTISLR